MLPIKYIIQGWWNVILNLISDIRYEKEFAERMAVCSTCEKNNRGVCGICGCVLIAKTKSEDSGCPLHKWEPIHSDK